MCSPERREGNAGALGGVTGKADSLIAATAGHEPEASCLGTGDGHDSGPRAHDSKSHRSIIQVDVHKSSRLQQSFLVERPVVRVHVVSQSTGRYFTHTSVAENQNLSAKQQADMLRMPGHPTMMTMHRGEKYCVGTLDFIPAIQTQVSVRQCL